MASLKEVREVSKKKLLESSNARIKSTMLGVEDHGILTFFIHLEWAGACQGLGGYGLDYQKSRDDETRVGNGCALIAIRKILEVVGVRRWEDLPGQLVRIKEGHDHKLIIGNIIEDVWFDLDAFVKEHHANPSA